MPEQHLAERPRAVTAIGWIWIVVAGYLLFRSVFDLLIWRALQPAMPRLLGLLESSSPDMPFVRPIFEHMAAYRLAEAILCAAILFVAYSFLRLRPWARRGMIGVCALGLAYCAGFAVFWALVWPRAAAVKARVDPLFAAHVNRTVGLLAGFAYCALLAAGIVLMIVSLQSERIRGAFGENRRIDSRRDERATGSP